jgi:hypothetical protein
MKRESVARRHRRLRRSKPGGKLGGKSYAIFKYVAAHGNSHSCSTTAAATHIRAGSPRHLALGEGTYKSTCAVSLRVLIAHLLTSAKQAKHLYRRWRQSFGLIPARGRCMCCLQCSTRNGCPTTPRSFQLSAWLPSTSISTPFVYGFTNTSSSSGSGSVINARLARCDGGTQHVLRAAAYLTAKGLAAKNPPSALQPLPWRGPRTRPVWF